MSYYHAIYSIKEDHHAIDCLLDDYDDWYYHEISSETHYDARYADMMNTVFTLSQHIQTIMRPVVNQYFDVQYRNVDLVHGVLVLDYVPPYHP